jgi:hypothetical protein
MSLSGRVTARVAAVDTRRFRITHCFHPYRGREFLLSEAQGSGEDRTLLFEDPTKDNMGWSGWEEFGNLTTDDKTNLRTKK